MAAINLFTDSSRLAQTVSTGPPGMVHGDGLGPSGDGVGPEP